MSKFQYDTTPVLITKFQTFIDRFWSSLNWWQKLILKGVKDQLDEFLNELDARLRQLQKDDVI